MTGSQRYSTVNPERKGDREGDRRRARAWKPISGVSPLLGAPGAAAPVRGVLVERGSAGRNTARMWIPTLCLR